MSAGIYVASRASIPSRAQMWRDLRNFQNWPIVSSWIYEDGPGQTKSLTELWHRIEQEVRSSHGVLLYAADGDLPLKGALVEVGMALGMGKRVAVVLDGIALEETTLRPMGSWLQHRSVSTWDTVREAAEFLLKDRVRECTNCEWAGFANTERLCPACGDRTVEIAKKRVDDPDLIAIKDVLGEFFDTSKGQKDKGRIVLEAESMLTKYIIKQRG